ncbi:CLUMA_CG019811, isoform A [Clunio marinus]|uniref:CLUMA_CG019811, isoform A n=1 Tax=Clunio marinus TaxID=568069 RepID=A0A1J1J361_9DIPT|nr:CLUMA_CG019811, isoform A [Clunio marinus]
MSSEDFNIQYDCHNDSIFLLVLLMEIFRNCEFNWKCLRESSFQRGGILKNYLRSFTDQNEAHQSTKLQAFYSAMRFLNDT